MERSKNNYPLGESIRGKVERHFPFGIFVGIGDENIRGIVQIPDFINTGDMTLEFFPDIDSLIGAVVIGYIQNDHKR